MRRSSAVWPVIGWSILLMLALSGRSQDSSDCLQRIARIEAAAAHDDWATVLQYSTDGLSPKGATCSSSTSTRGALYHLQGRARLHLDQPAAAVTAFHRAAHYLRLSAAADTLLAAVDLDLADAFVVLGQYDSLIHYFTTGIDRAERAPHFVPTQRLALACNNLGYHLGERQAYNLATRYYQSAIDYWQQLPDTDTADLSAAYFNLGSIKPGPSGIDYLLEALALNQAIGRACFAPRAMLGSKMQTIRRQQQALHYYDLALQELDTLVRTDIGRDYRYDLINTLSRRASLHRERKAWGDAQNDLVRALQIAQGSSWFKNSRIKLRTDLAEVLALQSGSVAAIPVLERTLADAAREKSYLFGYPAYNLAAHHAALGHYRRAVQYAQLSLRHAVFDDFDLSLPATPQDFSQQSFSLNSNYATLLTRYAQYLQKLPDGQSLAEAHFQAAIRLYEQCLSVAPDEQYTWQKYRSAARTYQYHLAQYPDQQNAAAAFYASEKAKSSYAQRAFAWQVAPIDESQEIAAFAEWRSLQSRITHLRELLYYSELDRHHTADTTVALQRQIFQLQQDLDSAQNVLQVIAPAFAASQRTFAPVPIDTLQHALSDTAAMLSFSIEAGTLHRYYITTDTFRLDTLSLPLSFEGDLQHFQQLLHQHDRDSINALYAHAHKLHQLLLPRAIPSHIRHLIIAPDPTFYALPFEVLRPDPDPRSPHFLLMRYTLSYAPSATLWVQQQCTPPRRHAKFWAGYIPSYSPQDLAPSDTLTNPHLAAIVREGQWALPGALQEGTHIAQLTQGDLWQGAQATEAHFKAHATDYQVLHLAMHASLNEHEPLYSRLHFQHLDAKASTQDLTIAELYTQQLQADLVVLSACNTGVGTHTEHQGLVSLANAFTAAGCPSTLMSLWQVPDATTAPIMIDFYRYLAQGMNKAAALQAAKRNYLEKALDSGQLHPFFWSGLVINGNYTAIDFPPRRSPLQRLGWGLLAFVGLGLLIWRYSRAKSRHS